MKCSSLLLFAVFFSLFTAAQAPYPLVKIDEGPAFGGPNEPSIAISLRDTQIIAAGSNVNNSYFSHDGGKTWEKQTLTSKYGVWGDPCLVPTEKGRFFFFHLSDPEGTNWASERLLDRIVCQRSNRKATRWSKGAAMGENHPKDQDKEWAAVNSDNGEVYATWTQFDKYNSENPNDKSNILFSVGNKRGKRWSQPQRINQYSGNCLDNDSTAEGAQPAVGPNGEIYVAWSFDESIYFDYSLDGGKSWLDEDIVVSAQPGGWKQDIKGIMRANGMPVIACDRSGGENHGTIYLNWTDQRNGKENIDVFVAKSIDGGKTWSVPTRVNTDDTQRQQFLTWMTIDQSTGYLYCVFYDRRNHVDTHTDVFLAVSKNGGKTWTNEQLNDKPFKPLPLVFFGDYNNIAAVNGKVMPIWTELHNGKLSIWTALINAQ